WCTFTRKLLVHFNRKPTTLSQLGLSGTFETEHLAFSYFFNKEIQDLSTHFSLHDIDGALQRDDNSWVFFKSGTGLFRYNGSSVRGIEMPFTGTVGRMTSNGHHIAILVESDSPFLAIYEVNTQEWSKIEIPSELRETPMVDITPNKQGPGFAVSFHGPKGLGLLLIEGLERNLRSTGWVNLPNAHETQNLQWHGEDKWILSIDSEIIVLDVQGDLKIDQRIDFENPVEQILPVSPQLAIVTGNKSAPSKRINIETRILSEKGLGPVKTVNGYFLNEAHGDVVLIRSKSIFSIIFQLDKETLDFFPISSSVSLNPSEAFTVATKGNGTSLFIGGNERSLIVSPDKNVLGNFEPFYKLSSSGRRGQVIHFINNNQFYYSRDFPKESPQLLGKEPFRFQNHPWKITKKSTLRHYDYKNLNTRINSKYLGYLNRSKLKTLYYDPFRERALHYNRISDKEMPDVIIFGKGKEKIINHLNGLEYDTRNLIATEKGYIELIGKFTGQTSNRFVAIQELDTDFTPQEYDKLKINPKLIKETPQFYADTLIPELEKRFDTYDTIWGLLGESDFHETEPGTLIKAFPLRTGPNVLRLVWKNDRFRAHTYTVEGSPNEYFGINKQGRHVFRGIPDTSIVEFKITESDEISPYSWSIPEEYHLERILTSTESNSWALVGRKGFNISRLVELKNLDISNPKLNIEILNKGIQSGDPFTAKLSVTTPYVLDKPILPYYFRWRYDNGPWSKKYPVEENTRDITIENLKPGIQRVEFKLIGYHDDDGISTSSAYIDVMPVPLQKRDWFPHLVITIFSVLTAVLIVAVIQSIRSVRNARALALLNKNLENIVLERTSEIDAQNQELIATNMLLEETNVKLLDTGKALAEASRKAGMAQVASGVIHNIGNIFNSITISLSLLKDDERITKALTGYNKLLGLFEKSQDQPKLLQDEKKLKASIQYLRQLNTSIEDTHTAQHQEFERINEGIQKVGAVMRSQEKYAKNPTDVKQDCTLKEVIQEALEVAAMKIPLSTVDVSIITETQTDHAMLDITYARQILVVLIENAYDASCSYEHQGRIEIHIDPGVETGSVRISIKDNGTGIHADDLPVLFSQGFTTKPGGSGTNLHDSVNLARVVGGNITAKNNADGPGATFYFDLPEGTLVEADSKE
ncbi:MAG: sensor histidine kinase, partial [Opitutales bacterium]